MYFMQWGVFLNIYLRYDLVFLDISISSGGRMLYFVHVDEIFVHQDHLGGGVDCKVRTACINDE